MDTEDLLERFTRVDVSRSSKGNGLGLSIAQGLTEAMGGTLTLCVDGDLFKVSHLPCSAAGRRIGNGLIAFVEP